MLFDGKIVMVGVFGEMDFVGTQWDGVKKESLI